MIVKRVSQKLKEYPDINLLMENSFPQNEQVPIERLDKLTLRENFNFRAFYDEDQFCGILYTIENDKYLFVLYLAVNDQIRSKGYGTKMLDWLKGNTEKIIVLNVETPNPLAENAVQRERRIAFYSKNGIYDSKSRFSDKGESYSVLTSDVEHYVPEEYANFMREFTSEITHKQTM